MQRAMLPVENLADTSMTDSQLSGDDTWSDTRCCHLNDLQSDVVGERSAIDEDSSQLIDSTLA